MHQDDAVGNVEAALDLYRRALAAKPDRALAARAQLRIGLCQEKLGRPEARQSFEAVLRDYADQGAVTAEARARLARQTPGTPAPPAGTGLDAIQLWSGNDIEGAASLSPDGRYLVYSTWTENGNLLVKDFTTGVVRPITRDAAVRTDGYPQPWSPKFSPDGSRIAYPWFERGGTSHRIIDRDGANLRIVARGSTGGQMDAVYAWSPDGRQLAINLYATGQSRLALLSIADGSIVPLKATGWHKATVGGFSPDGKYLVYSLPVAANVPNPGVFALAIDGGSETKLADGISPAWTPDGRAVVFFSERSGTGDLWMVPVANGKSTDSPTLLRPNIGRINHGFIRDGSLFYEARTDGRDVLVTRFDPARQHIDQPTMLTEAFVGSNGGAAWSADGQHVVFARGTERTATKLVIRTVATGEERVVPTTLGDGLPVQNFGCRWFPDGRAVLIPAVANGRRGFAKVDVLTGSQQVLIDAPMGGQGFSFDLSPDGQSLYYVQRRETSPAGQFRFGVIKRDLQTGHELELHHTQSTSVGVTGLTVSPNGEHIAVRDAAAATTLLLPTTGGTPHELRKGEEALEPLAWSSDGQYVLGGRDENDREHLWAIPVAGGALVSLNISADHINTVSVSRADGRIAVSLIRPHHELWLVRNLLKPSASR
jgi:Tol biopolymer transport system component